VIKRKKKVCKSCGHQKYLFGRGMCKFCYGVAAQKKKQSKPQKKKQSKISRVSSTNTYSDSHGNRYTKAEIDVRVREAKRKAVEKQVEEFGYNFCTSCGENTCKPIDASHIVSVDECQKLGKVELAWDWENNIRMEGRACHMETEKQSHNQRIERYLDNKPTT